MGLTNGSVHITLHNNDPVIPGTPLTGTATLTLTKPLSLSYFAVTVFGSVFTRIYRVYLIRNFQAEWQGQGFPFKRFVILIPTPTTLQPGEHTFPFSVDIPATTDNVKGNWHRFVNWKDRAPFPGKKTVHQVPGTMKMDAKQRWGSADGWVEYVAVTEIKKRPDEGFFSWIPKADQPFDMACLPRTDLPPPVTTAGPGYNHASPAGLDAAFADTNLLRIRYTGSCRHQLEAKLYIVYLIRARSLLWTEKRTKTAQMIQLVDSQGKGSVSLGNEFKLVYQRDMPEQIPVPFMTYSLACLAHWGEVRFRVKGPDGQKEVKDVFKNIPVQVQSWTVGEIQGSGMGGKVGENYSGFSGEVFIEEEFRRWKAARRSNTT
ncbi:uncharacterized protein BDV14DRAFT_203179 [Aspergillus stella-maris]|uniref:uncharacterized protein n=1 Tax=Aspergillus stella-maris TaxID=1810926 RepID=UPI003CCD0783